MALISLVPSSAKAAATYTRRSYVPRLLSINVDPQEALNTAFRIACRQGRVDDAKRLLGEGAQIDGESGDERTALGYAAQHCQSGMVRYLLKAGADPNHQDKTKRTPLIHATRGLCLPAIKVLLAWPATNPFLADKNSKNALAYVGISVEARELFEKYGAGDK